ncbi:hypothetical protein G5V57_31495 [Nordella sp. HKS 07]|uniref:hypothetical protein n=1 Tax=Nordella sp. HKS 07 TaxID=2712222 RepID=UPI0013E12AB9|nr:hypothetical protein [Nordella sp. HKS 07]QIG51835.1 hypothetical protein G5V57_31495 [Nordella sp. HKS 07]
MSSRQSSGTLFAMLLLLLSSLMMKIPIIASNSQWDINEVTRRIEIFLQGNGFRTVHAASDEDMFIISAAAGDCELSIASLSLQGWHRHVIRNLTPIDYSLRFLFDGKLYLEQPLLLTRSYDYWSRLSGFISEGNRSHRLYGIVASSECSLDKINWHDLSNRYAAGLLPIS